MGNPGSALQKCPPSKTTPEKGTFECQTRKVLVLTSTALWSWNNKGTPCSHFLCLSYPPCLTPSVCFGLSVQPREKFVRTSSQKGGVATRHAPRRVAPSRPTQRAGRPQKHTSCQQQQQQQQQRQQKHQQQHQQQRGPTRTENSECNTKRQKIMA